MFGARVLSAAALLLACLGTECRQASGSVHLHIKASFGALEPSESFELGSIHARDAEDGAAEQEKGQLKS